MQVQDMDQNSSFLDTIIDHELTYIVWSNSLCQNCLFDIVRAYHSDVLKSLL